jgi:HTH-type transcriptional regulator/antitoxin HigA
MFNLDINISEVQIQEKENKTTLYRHPGIILGRLQHEGLIPYNNLRILLVKVKPFISDWIYE